MWWDEEPEDKVREVLAFWYKESGPDKWYAKSGTFDASIRERFSGLYHRAAQCELFPWRRTPTGRLAEIIILDQFPRNMFRDTARAFESDPLALALAQASVAVGADEGLPAEARAFLYHPYMHSESRLIHSVAEKLFRTVDEAGIYWELKHKAVIDRFGRYPHRNEVLGRESTPEEVAFLKEPGNVF